MLNPSGRGGLAVAMGAERWYLGYQSSANGCNEPRKGFPSLQLLRQKTPREIASATLLFAPAFSLEMWRALRALLFRCLCLRGRTRRLLVAGEGLEPPTPGL